MTDPVFLHGENTYVAILNTASPGPTGTFDLSDYVNTSTLTLGNDTHDVTCYGKTAHVFSVGLETAKFTMGGFYDKSTTAAPKVLRSLRKQKVQMTRRPEGTGTGLTQQQFDVIVGSYAETNPSDDMITWTCEFTISDAVTETTQ